MAQTIKLKSSSVRGATPTTASLDLREIAINTHDGKAYLEKSGSSGYEIQSFVTTDSQTTGSIEITGNISGSATSTGSFGKVESNTLSVFDRIDSISTLANSTGVGEIVTFGTMSTPPTAGQVLFMNTSGQWVLADSDDITKGADSLLGIAMGTSLADGVMLRGFFDNRNYLSSFSAGDALYLTATEGVISTTAPTSGFVRVVGYCTDTSAVMYFNPGTTWVEID